MRPLPRRLLTTLGLLGSLAAVSHADARSPLPFEPPAERDSESQASLVVWLRAHAPSGTQVSAHEGDVTVTYETKDGDTVPSIARALLPLSETYLGADFAGALTKANPLLRSGVKPNMRLTVPELVRRPPEEGERGRIGWSKGEAIKGVYIRGTTAAGCRPP